MTTQQGILNRSGPRVFRTKRVRLARKRFPVFEKMSNYCLIRASGGNSPPQQIDDSTIYLISLTHLKGKHKR